MLKTAIIGFGGIAQSVHLKPHLAFENATVSFANGKVTVFVRGEKEPADVNLPAVDPYEAEIRFFIDCIEGRAENVANKPSDSALTVKLVQALAESAEKNGEIIDWQCEVE